MLSEGFIMLSEASIRLSDGPIRLGEGPIRLSEGSISPSEGPVRLSEGSISPSEGRIYGFLYKFLGFKTLKMVKFYRFIGSILSPITDNRILRNYRR